MGLTIGFDLDGVIADFATACREIEVRLFGSAAGMRSGGPDAAEESDLLAANDLARLPASSCKSDRRRAIWEQIQATPDFWMTLNPIEGGAVRRIFEQMLRHRWEVVFITQRPPTKGETVQRQTQRWLTSQGFDMPSVLVISGSRGVAAAALRLDYHVDDSAQHCLDMMSDSRASPILVVPAGDPTAQRARKLGIGVAHSIGECLDFLDEASVAGQQQGVLQRLAARVGWKRVPEAKPQRAAP